jgi:hypothetical protein
LDDVYNTYENYQPEGFGSMTDFDGYGYIGEGDYQYEAEPMLAPVVENVPW